MIFQKENPIDLKGYDYSSNGVYFITIVRITESVYCPNRRADTIRPCINQSFNRIWRNRKNSIENISKYIKIVWLTIM